jgi:E3 ubiquitin-protein ligase HECTD3
MVKNYLLQKKKCEWLEASSSKTVVGTATKLPEVKFDTMKASIDGNEGENTMFNQAFEQLHEDAHIIFRFQNERLWFAKYVDMHSIDQGGPYRDSITAICADICSTRLPLFILCPNGQANNGLNCDCWIPNVFPPNKPISNKFKKQYQFIGQLMGMAIRKKNYLNVKFPALLWKQLIGEEITMIDIEAIDIQSFTILKEMENSIERNQLISTDSDIKDLCSSILSELRFDVISSSGETYELIPGGQDIPVTADNLKEYCIRYREYRLNEFHRQIEYIRQGLCSVVPSDLLTLFTAN